MKIIPGMKIIPLDQETEMRTDQLNTAKPTILVVDDKPETLHLLVNLLAQEGYNVRPVQDGQMALSTAQDDPPDLVLLDIMMPGLDGYEVCQQLKADERTHDVPVIFVTVLNDEANKVKAFSAGGADYITKPFRIEGVLLGLALNWPCGGEATSWPCSIGLGKT